MRHELAQAPRVLKIESIFALTRHLNRYQQVLAVALLFVVALAIRLDNLNQPPLGFHAVRQYRSLIIARALYYESTESVPAWKRQVASISSQRQGVLEPPITEFVVSSLYGLVGGEQFWVPRLVSSIFWLIGGIFLYLVARRLADQLAAMFSMAFYLFLPFAVVASRSFQPDPLMIMMLLITVFAILRYYDRPSTITLAMASTAAALASFIKPVSLFAIMGVFVSLAIQRQGTWRGTVNPKLLIFAAISLLPTVLFYSYGMFIAGFLRDQAQASFLPNLFLTSFFWKNWLINIGLVVGFIPFIGALLGIPLVQNGSSRAVLIGLWVGYAVFCLVFSYHIATHDYYHLQLVPIVALSVGPVFALVMQHLNQACTGWRCRVAIGGALVLALLLSLGLARARLVNSDSESRKAIAAQEIGERVRHSTQTVYLDPDYGLPLEYHGELSGRPWPLASDLEWERLAGVRVPSAEERFAAWFANSSPEYFIVTDRREFEEQLDLRSFLTSRFPVMAQSDDYLIFDLKSRVDLDRQIPAATEYPVSNGEMR